MMASGTIAADRFAGLREEFEAEWESRPLYRVQVRRPWGNAFRWVTEFDTRNQRAAEAFARDFADHDGHFARVVAIQAVTAKFFEPGPARQD